MTPGIPIPIPQTGAGIPGIGAAGPNGAVGAPGKSDGEAFAKSMNSAGASQTGGAHATPDAANSANSVNKTDAVTNRNEVPNAEGLVKSTEERNMGKLIDRNRQIWENKLQSGEISEDNHQLQTWRLMGVQQRVQEIHLRVQMVTKVVDHGTQSVKQLSQTQA